MAVSVGAGVFSSAGVDGASVGSSVGSGATIVSTMVATGDAVAVGVGSSAFAGMPSRAATAAALIKAVERIRRVTLL